MDTPVHIQWGRFLPADLVGRTIGKRYNVRELVGQGGTSVIYRARDARLGRTIALKVIGASRIAVSQLEEERVQRFLREGKGLAQLDHANIVTVFDTGVDQELIPDYDVYYIAMEYLEGVTLDRYLKRLESDGERMTWQEILRVVRDVASALDYAHTHELAFIHRDVTPGNIMLADGRACLFDFGLLKVQGVPLGTSRERTFAEFLTFTQEGVVLGTPAYWAPEQVTGSEVDRRTDVYALGGVLFRMLAGRLPYEAEDALGMSVQHLHDPPPRPSSVNPALFAFDPIIARAMAKSPADRYSSAGEIARALDNSLEITPDPVSGQRLAAARGVARKVLWAAGGIAVALAVIALVLGIGVNALNWFQPSADLPLGWQSTSRGILMEQVDDHRYQVTVNASHASYVLLQQGAKLENPHISMEGELTSGPLETAYGIVFQHTDDANYYVFAVTGDGQVGLWQRKGDDWLPLTEGGAGWEERMYVHPDRPNRLEVTIEGNRAWAEINNQPEFEIELDSAQAGSVGVYISTSRQARNPKATTLFDYVVRR